MIKRSRSWQNEQGRFWSGRSGGMPPEGNFAPEGLYTFDVAVFANPYDGSLLRSVALKVERGPVEYFGYDDGAMPEDETDDNHLYYFVGILYTAEEIQVMERYGLTTLIFEGSNLVS